MMNEDLGYSRPTDSGESTSTMINKMAGRFRVPPRSEFLRYAIDFLTGNMRLSSAQCQRIFDRALNELDTFPSIAQIVSIKNSLVRDGDPLFKPRPRAPSLPEPIRAKYPWPNSLIGLVMGFDDPRGVSPSGMRSLGLDATEAKYLYDCWKKQDWKNEWAVEIMAKCDFSIEHLIAGK